MYTVITILLAVVMFGLIIFIHELGHFLTAKSVGIGVNEFAIGMGPTLLRFQRGETTYALRLFPFGGFVAMEGEDEDSDSDRAFCNKKVWQRILVVVAGATMNVLMGLVIMVGLAASQPLVSTTQISYFDPAATSSQKLQLGDEILEINGSSTHIVNDMLFAFINAGDGPVEMTVRRDGERMTFTDVPFQYETLEDGTRMVRLDFKVQGKERTLPLVLREGWYMTTGVVKQVWISFGKLITGQFQMNQLSGPVGVTEAIGQVAASKDHSNLLMMVAFITINIGVFNLLPIPALDGGRLVFLLVEGVRGKPVPPKYEGLVHATGLMLLMGLMVVVTFHDIVRIFFQ